MVSPLIQRASSEGARVLDANGPWSARTSSLWAFIELRMARSSQKSGIPSAISKATYAALFA
jgi:hypothetical protein